MTLVGLVGDRPYGTVLQAARLLQSGDVVVGASEQGVERQAGEIRGDWQHLAACGEAMHVEIVPDGDGAPTCLELGPAGEAPR